MADDTASETATSPVESGRSGSDDVHSRFAHLHDRLDERQNSRSEPATQAPTKAAPFSPADRPDTESGTTDTDCPNRSGESDSHARLKALFAERASSATRDDPSSPSENRSNGIRLLFVGLILGVVLALVVSGVVLASSAHLSDTVLAPPPTEYVDADDAIYLTPENAAYLSRIFEETTHEVAYCGLITHDEETPTLDVWMADTVNAGPDRIEFLTDNCPGNVQEVLLHTHPSGSLGLSETDRNTLAERPEEIMCVQGGALTTEPGAELDNLACYKQLRPDDPGVELSQIPVVVTDDDSGR